MRALFLSILICQYHASMPPTKYIFPGYCRPSKCLHYFVDLRASKYLLESIFGWISFSNSSKPGRSLSLMTTHILSLHHKILNLYNTVFFHFLLQFTMLARSFSKNINIRFCISEMTIHAICKRFWKYKDLHHAAV